MTAESRQHKAAKEYFCQRPELLLPYLTPHLGEGCRIVYAQPEYGLFNGKPDPLGVVDIMLVAVTPRGTVHVPVEVKASGVGEDRALKAGKRQLRRYHGLAKHRKIDFPTAEDMPLGLVVVGTFRSETGPVRYVFSTLEF